MGPDLDPISPSIPVTRPPESEETPDPTKSPLTDLSVTSGERDAFRSLGPLPPSLPDAKAFEAPVAPWGARQLLHVCLVSSAVAYFAASCLCNAARKLTGRKAACENDLTYPTEAWRDAHRLICEVRGPEGKGHVSVLALCTLNQHRSASLHFSLEQACLDGRLENVTVDSRATLLFQIYRNLPLLLARSDGLAGRLARRAAPWFIRYVNMSRNPLLPIAENAGVDHHVVSRFHSQPLTLSAVDTATIIIALDRRQREVIERYFPQAAARTFLVGRLVPAGLPGFHEPGSRKFGDVLDPGKGEISFQDCFLAIRQAADRFIVPLLSGVPAPSSAAPSEQGTCRLSFWQTLHQLVTGR